MTLRTLAALALMTWAPASPAADAPTTLDLWPGPAPGESTSVGEEKYLTSKPEERCQKKLTNVSKPTLTVYRPDKANDTGAAVVVAPGGGYHILAMDLEGEEVAAWLNSMGVTAVVLKYRVPRRPGTPGDQAPPGALQDAQRAISLVRSKAAEWALDPKRLGMLGFSAGGHLTAWTATHGDDRSYEPVDGADKESCRPDFAVLVYPAYLVDPKKPGELKPDIKVSVGSPPCFFAHAADDPISPENSLVMFSKLRAARVPAELHVYASGGHGFGLRPEGTPCSTWPQRCAEWMKDRGILSGKGSPRGTPGAP